MATYTKALLSGSTSGRGILVVANASVGTTIHTAAAGAAAWDEVWLFAYNSSATPVVLTLQWGGTTAVNDDIKMTIPGLSGLVEVAPGLLLNGGLTIAAYGGTANVLTIHGWVNKIA